MSIIRSRVSYYHLAGASFQQEYLGACFEVGTGERTSTGLVYCNGWWAIFRARKVCELGELIDLGRAEGGYDSTLDVDGCSIYKPDKGESKDRP